MKRWAFFGTLFICLASAVSHASHPGLNVLCKRESWFKTRNELSGSGFTSQFIVNHQKGLAFVTNSGTEPLYILVNGQRAIKIQKNKIQRLVGHRNRYDAEIRPTVFERQTYPGLSIGYPHYELIGVNVTKEFFEKFKIGPNRPDNPPIPEPIKFQFTVEYKGLRDVIDGKIIFQLDPDYDPNCLRSGLPKGA